MKPTFTQFRLLSELAYEGNVGIEELMMFYKIADDDQKDQLEEFLVDENIEEALALIELVTGTKLVHTPHDRYDKDIHGGYAARRNASKIYVRKVEDRYEFVKYDDDGNEKKIMFSTEDEGRMNDWALRFTRKYGSKKIVREF
tara:strand:+ start:380 stop:808 length:429 start_codon:yes stop_codon:yes gene_type:complete